MNEADVIEQMKRQGIAELPEVKGVEILRLSSGDFVVLRAEGRISQEQAHRLKIEMERLFPNNKCLVLDEGMTLKVIKSDA